MYYVNKFEINNYYYQDLLNKIKENKMFIAILNIFQTSLMENTWFELEQYVTSIWFNNSKNWWCLGDFTFLVTYLLYIFA